MAMKIKLTKEQQQYLIGGAIFLAGFCFVYFKYFWMPTSKRIADARAEIDKVEKEIQTAKANAARLPRIEAELALLNQQAVEAEKRLPKTKDVPTVLVTMTQLARRHNVEVLRFSPGGSKPSGFFDELTYPMTVKGRFHAVGKFLAAISLVERIFNVREVGYGQADEATGVMNVNFTLVSYQYKG